MNTITIKSWDDFVNKQKTILLHGKEHNKGMQFYKELCPCVVEIQTDCIRDIAKRFFESRNPWNSPDGNDFCRFETVMNHVIYGKEDFTDIPGSEYIGSDYYRVYRCFSFYKHEKISGILTRRQF